MCRVGGTRPVCKRLVPTEVAWKGVGFAALDHRPEHAPDRVVVFRSHEPDRDRRRLHLGKTTSGSARGRPPRRPSIHHHRPDRLALVHEVEALVDAFEAQRVGDHRVDLDLSLHVPVDDPRHVRAPPRAAEGGAAPGPAGHQLEGPGGNLGSGGCDPDDDALAPALVGAFERRAHDAHVPGRVESVVRTPLREVDEMGHQIALHLGGIHEIGHAEPLRHRHLVGVEVDADDLVGAGEPQPLDHVEADAAEAEDDRPAADLDLRGVDDGADAGRRPAADLADLVEGRVLADLRKGYLGQDGVVRERRAPHVVQDRVAIEGGEPRGAVGHEAGPLRRPDRLAEVPLRMQAVFAFPALGRVERNDEYCLHPKTNLCQAIRSTQGAGLMPDGTSRFSTLDGDPILHYMGCSTFSSHTVLPEIALAKVRKDAPFDKICYIGCGVTTGIGAVINTAKVEIGSRAIVFGLGGIGLNVIQGLRLAGADQIVGVDLNPDKRAMAEHFGMTDFVNPTEVESDLVPYLVDLTKGGADYTFDATGNVQVMRAALESAHKGWGESIIIGVAPAGAEISTRPFQLVTGRSWRGTAFGGARGRTDVPKIVDWYMDGKIEIDPMITHTMPLDDINKGFDLMHAGESIRSVVIY